MVRNLILLLLLSPLLSPPLAGQNVVIVVIDGLRHSEGPGAGATHMPRLWNDLRPQGMVWPEFRNEGTTTTVSGHATVMTGTWQHLPNDGSARPTAPTLFEYFRHHTGAPATKAYAVVGKTKLNVCTHGTDSAYGAGYAGTYAFGSGDTGVIAVTCSVLTAFRPRVLLLNLPDVDLEGHTGNWDAYLRAIRRADSLVHFLWGFLEADSGYAGRTTMFVTNDHGRHDDANGGFQHHGDGCEGCRRIMLLAIGRHIPPGMTGMPVRTQRDIAGPAGALLGVPTPSVQGANLLADTTTVDAGEADHGTALPHGIRLEPGFPNPFNPSTTITVHMDARTRASLLIYDLLGRQVAVLARGEFPAGRSAYTWHAGGAAAGLYICRLDAGVRKASRKLLLTR